MRIFEGWARKVLGRGVAVLAACSLDYLTNRIVSTMQSGLSSASTPLVIILAQLQSTQYIVVTMAALPLLCISAVGWIVYVVGFSLFYQKSRRFLPIQSGRNEALLHTIFVPYWIFLVSALLSYIFHFIYLLIGNSLLGLPTNFFTVLSLATGGMVLFHTSIGLPSFEFMSIYRATTFAGCLIAELFLGISVLLWLFYTVSPPEFCINLTEEDRQAFSSWHPLHFQPDGSIQQLMFTQLAPLSAFPQTSVRADISSLQQQLNSLERLMQAMAEHQGIPVEGKPDQKQ